MSNDLTPKVSVESLVKSYMEGTASESESGILLRTLQTAVSGALVTGMSALLGSLSAYDEVLARAQNKLIEKINVNLESDIMSVSEITDVISTLTSKKLAILDLYRKVAQGKELFPSDVISEEEKKVLKLLKSFKSENDKKKFIELCEQTFSAPTESNDFEDEK